MYRTFLNFEISLIVPIKPTNPKTSTKVTKQTTKSMDELLSEGLTENVCLSEDYGYMPHPKDCRKYIYCQEGIIKVFTCQGGLFWKQSDGNCVWPSDSDCNYNPR